MGTSTQDVVPNISLGIIWYAPTQSKLALFGFFFCTFSADMQKYCSFMDNFFVSSPHFGD